MKNIFKLLVLAVLTTGIVSCSSSKKVEPVKVSNLPEWVINPDSELKSTEIGAIGIASPSKGGEKFQFKQAELDAKANLAAKIGSEISRVTKNALRSAKVNEADDVEEFFAQATKEVVKNFPMSGAVRRNMYVDDKGSMYILVVMDENNYTKFLNASERKLKSELKKSNLSRENIDKSQEATKSLFDELETERKSKE